MTTPATTGNIYDLGYQGYDGPRLGRRHAVWALYTFSLKSAFGIGRNGRAKIAPFGFAFLALFPALIAVGVSALVSQAGGAPALESRISYGTYLGYCQTMLILFCAAQAPELVGRDQRYHVLSLYFSRALRRTDYGVAKLLAIGTALFLVFLVPEAVLFLGRVLASKDVPAAFVSNLSNVAPVIAIGLTAAALLGGLSLALASFSPRRAYATAAIIATFVVPPIVASIVTEVASGPLSRVMVFLDPNDLLDGANAWFFGRTTGNAVLLDADVPAEVFVLVALAYAAVAALATLRRYERIDA